ncbi:MAG: hypothetical protein JW836_08885 [Deltaproteobacteria bacterium]|nr:hypothetical protein [Deltaproteobacteria bacterium]
MNSRKMVLFGNLIIAAIVFWMMVSIVFTWISERRGPDFLKTEAWEALGARSEVPRQRKTLTDYGMIKEKDVFKAGKFNLGSPVGEKVVSHITERNLELKGTVVAEGRMSYAVILDHDLGKEDIYFEDDFVTGARIARILKNMVVLDSKGKEEALLMSHEKRAFDELGYSSQLKPAPR